MQSPMMLAFVQSRETEWQRDQPAEPRPISGARSDRTRPPRAPLIRVALALLMLGLLAASQLDLASARTLPVCSQTNLRYIRPDLPPPMLGEPCGNRPLLPPLPAEETDTQPFWAMFAKLDELWAIVFDLLPDLASSSDQAALD
jgi:hypothetical protein